jgi:type I restriction enzyme S subunit
MNDIIIDKTSWKKYRFGDVAIQTKEVVDVDNTDLKRYVAGEHMDSEDIHIRKWGTVGDGYLGPAFIRRFHKGDILYGSRRTYLKKVAIADFDGITANTTFVIKAKEELIEPVLLVHLMLSKSFTEYSVTNSRGSVNPYINWKDIADYEFLLPPKPEQKRLAALLWAADEMIEKEKMELEKVEEYRKLTFELHTSKQANAKLADCLIVNKRKSKAPHYYDKYLGLEHIESGVYYSSQYGEANEVLADSYIFHKGALLYGKLRPYLDKCIISDFDGICSTEIIVYSTEPNTSKEYILNVLHSKAFLDYIVDKSFGTKMPRVSHEIISDYELFLPSKKEQNEIVNIIGNIINQEKRVREQITLSQQIKQELINKVF